MKTLGVTSPYTSGPEVAAAQRHLKRGNIFGTDYLRGPIDNVFGEETGRGCIRAKFWFGYPYDEYVKPIYGDQLDGLLTGSTAMPQDYQDRRDARLAELKEKPLRVHMLDQAKRYLGQTEAPAGSNHVVWASAWYGLDRQPWCAMAVTRWAVDAGSTAFVRGSRYAYCPYIVNDARAGRNGLSVVREPLPGDLALYDWGRDGIADHIELFEGWVNKTNGYFKAIGGNTSRDDSGSQSNGGGCFRRGEAPGQGDTRRVGPVQAFGPGGR